MAAREIKNIETSRDLLMAAICQYPTKVPFANHREIVTSTGSQGNLGGGSSRTRSGSQHTGEIGPDGEQLGLPNICELKMGE